VQYQLESLFPGSGEAHPNESHFASGSQYCLDTGKVRTHHVPLPIDAGGWRGKHPDERPVARREQAGLLCCDQRCNDGAKVVLGIR